MSELEIIKREEYKQNRKKWMMIQIIIIVSFLFISLGSFMIYNKLNQTYYIEYTECACIDYKVQYNENEYFDKEWIEKDQTYISSLINSIEADFDYELKINATNISFNYNYKLDALMIIADKETGKNYYSIEENIIPLTNKSNTRSIGVNVNEETKIDYVKYNQIASSFVKTYNLKNSSSTLIVTLTVEVLSQSESFEEHNENIYTISLNIPLVVETFAIHTTSSAPQCESKILAYKNNINTKAFYIISIITGVCGTLLICGLFVFLQMTKNEDITYAAKIRKITNSYGAFIQRIVGDFDDSNYQRVMIQTFNEMLNIRDTLQAPILLSENKDKTMSTFLIPTDNKLLYVFEIKVDNYDELYSKSE